MSLYVTDIASLAKRKKQELEENLKKIQSVIEIIEGCNEFVNPSLTMIKCEEDIDASPHDLLKEFGSHRNKTSEIMMRGMVKVCKKDGTFYLRKKNSGWKKKKLREKIKNSKGK